MFSKLKPLYPLVIFDLDGTIINSQPSIYQGLTATLQHFSIQPEESEVLSASFLGIRDLVEKISQETGVSKADFNKKFSEIFLKLIPAHTEFFPGIKDLLSSLSKICCLTILTNKSQVYCRPTVEALGLEQYFQGIFYHESFAEPKPSPVPVNAIIDQFGFSKNQTILIGDTIKDLQAAKNALISSCYVSYGYGHDQQAEIEAVSYTYRANSAEEIAKIFNV